MYSLLWYPLYISFYIHNFIVWPPYYPIGICVANKINNHKLPWALRMKSLRKVKFPNKSIFISFRQECVICVFLFFLGLQLLLFFQLFPSKSEDGLVGLFSTKGWIHYMPIFSLWVQDHVCIYHIHMMAQSQVQFSWLEALVCKILQA